MRLLVLTSRIETNLLIIAGAWAALALMNGTEFSIYLDHGDWTKVGLLGSLCGADLSRGGIADGFWFLVSWQLMLVAMMGPVAFEHLKRNGRMSVGAVTGYLAIWTIAGIGLHAIGHGLEHLAEIVPWLMFNGWSIGTAALLFMGLYQFSPLKGGPQASGTDLCPAAPGHDFVGGLRQGLMCLRSCGLLMCLMFLFFPGSLLWMAFIAGIMILDRCRFGHRGLRYEIGIALIAASGVFALSNLI